MNFPFDFFFVSLDFSAISPLVGFSCHLPHPFGLDLADMGGHSGQAVQGEDQQGGEGHGQPTTTFKQAVKSKAQVKHGENQSVGVYFPL